MFIRGSGVGTEYKRDDQSFYRGIVVKNNDPLKMNRVKIYIAELTNQPYDDWFEKYLNFNLKSPGKNSNPTSKKNKDTTNWKDVKLFEEMCLNIPWAEPCYPIIGESGNYRFFKDGEISTISDCNYEKGFEEINTKSPSLSSGSFSPAFLYENYSTVIDDNFSNPGQNFTVKCNPHSFSYRPSKHVNNTKGIIGVPEVGSKVWVFHYEGDLNFPIYFGVMQDFRSLTTLNYTDNKKLIGAKYPNEFEN